MTRHMTVSMLALATLIGCNGPEPTTEPSDPPAPSEPEPQTEALQIVTESLPAALVGDSYTTFLEATGGEAPIRWTLTGELPQGLVFNPAGAISGLPTASGTFPLTIEATGEDGSSDTVTVDLLVDDNALVLNCGDTVSGTFTEPGEIDYDEVDWDATGGYAWLRLPVAAEPTTRMELTVSPALVAYVTYPGQDVTTQDLEPLRRTEISAEEPYRIDLGTSSSLDDYRGAGDALGVLLVGSSEAWSAGLDCSDGPILDDPFLPPTRQADPLELSFVAIDAPNAVYSTDDPLPGWATLEPDGRVSGTAVEPGLVAFDMTVTATDGRVRTEAVSFGVYEVVDLPCDSEISVQTTKAYFDGPVFGDDDPEGYVVMQTALPPEVSSATLTVDGTSVGVVSFGHPLLPPYIGSNHGEVAIYDAVDLTLSSRSMPNIGHAVDLSDSVVYSQIKDYFSSGTFSASMVCSRQPLPDLAMLPVREPGETLDVVLPTRGGTAPITWSAAGLPAGVSLTPDGTLSFDGTAPFDTHSVTLTLTDSLGAVGIDTYDLWVGESEACGGDVVLTCGDHLDDIAPDGLYAPGWIPQGLCLSAAALATGSVEVAVTTDGGEVALGINDPGLMGYTNYWETGGDFAAYGAGTYAFPWVIDSTTFPAIADFPDGPAYLSVAAFDPTGFSVDVICP